MSLNKKFAVILSGCGKLDGSEVHEATTALLAIDMAGISYQCFAPNIEQAKTINHLNGNIMSVRDDKFNHNVLVESARIARGEIKDIKELNVKDFDAIIFPGGMGAVTNLCNYAEKGVDCQVDILVRKTIEEANSQRIAIGAMCIAPVLISKVLGNKGVVVTIGNDVTTAVNIEKMGAKHINTLATGVCIDEKHKIVTTPAYMSAKSIKEVFLGATEMVSAITKIL